METNSAATALRFTRFLRRRCKLGSVGLATSKSSGASLRDSGFSVTSGAYVTTAPRLEGAATSSGAGRSTWGSDGLEGESTVAGAAIADPSTSVFSLNGNDDGSRRRSGGVASTFGGAACSSSRFENTSGTVTSIVARSFWSAISTRGATRIDGLDGRGGSGGGAFGARRGTSAVDTNSDGGIELGTACTTSSMPCGSCMPPSGFDPCARWPLSPRLLLAAPSSGSISRTVPTGSAHRSHDRARARISMGGSAPFRERVAAASWSPACAPRNDGQQRDQSKNTSTRSRFPHARALGRREEQHVHLLEHYARMRSPARDLDRLTGMHPLGGA